MVTGSPELGVALSAIGATGVYQKVGGEMADRLLGPREKARIGCVLAMSVEILKSELDQGKTLREDGFFDKTIGRSDAEEVMEGVLRKAQAEYEERKLEYLARLWSTACLDETFGADKLNYMVKLAEQLTYRQLVILSIAGAMTKANNSNIFDLREQHYENAGLKMGSETSIVLSEIMVLHNLICVKVIAPLGHVQIAPSELRIYTSSVALYVAMGLSRIGNKDRQHVIDLLK